MIRIKALPLLLAVMLLLGCAALAEGNDAIQLQAQAGENVSLPDGVDLSQYTYEELTLLQQAVENRLADLDRQTALENADRQIAFAEPEISCFTHRTVFQNPTVSILKDTAPARTAFTWSSSDPGVAQVNTNGRVAGISRGTATITAAAKDNPYLTASYTVQILVPLEKLSVMGESDTLLLSADPALAETFLSVIAEPEDAYIPPVHWSSSNPEIASVDANGIVYGKSAGKTEIYATIVENPDLGIRARQIVYAMTVIQPVTGVTLDVQNLTLAAGQTYALNAVVLPENADNKALSWTSSDENVVKTDASGNLTAVNGGEADVTAETQDGSGLSAACHVTVTQPVAALNITNPEETMLNLSVGTVRSVMVQVLPETATNQELVWTSSNVLVARVADGSVEAVGAGDCIVTCAALDGSGISTQLAVHVPAFLVESDAFVVTEKTGLTIPVAYSAMIDNLEVQVTGEAFTASLDEAGNLAITPENGGEGTVILQTPADRQEIRITVENTAVYDEVSYPMIPYEDIVKNPFAYINMPMSISGRILRVQETTEKEITLTIGTAGNDYSDQVLWVRVPVSVMPEELTGNEQITIYGTFQMEQLYSESLQSNTLIPAIVAEKVKVGS